MSNPPGVSVSQIATQVEAFDQIWIELVLFPDMADGDLSACVPWQRGMGGHFYHGANRLLRNYQDIPRAGGCFNPARRNAETALAAAAPLGRKSSFFGDLPTQDAISGYLDNSGVSHQLQGEELSVGSGWTGIRTHRDSTMSSGHPTHMDKPYRSYITDETVKVGA